jgi:hypothetical protein
MATVKYSENACVLSGLQGGTRDHKASETEQAKIIAYETMINALSLLPVKHNLISDRQRYYNPTIERKSAYHGAFLKLFQWFDGFSLVISGSLDHQYPLEIHLVYSGLLVKSLFSFKGSSRAITNGLLPDKVMLAETIANRLNQLNLVQIADIIDRQVSYKTIEKLPYHFRYFKKACNKLMTNLGI